MNPRIDKHNHASSDLAKEAEELQKIIADVNKGWAKGIELVTIERNEYEQLRLTMPRYKGHLYLNICLWMLDPETDTWRPQKDKVLSVRIRELPDFAVGVSMAMDLAREELSQPDGEEQ